MNTYPGSHTQERHMVVYNLMVGVTIVQPFQTPLFCLCGNVGVYNLKYPVPILQMVVRLEFSLESFPVFSHRTQMYILGLYCAVLGQIFKNKVACSYRTFLCQPLVTRKRALGRSIGIDCNTVYLRRIPQNIAYAEYLISIVTSL